MYLNGTGETSVSWTNASGYAGTNYVRVGIQNNSGSDIIPLDGEIDEVRLVGEALSNDWITTEYNNQNSPSTFWTPVSGVTFTPKVMFF
jgi:hypothetical protein